MCLLYTTIVVFLPSVTTVTSICIKLRHASDLVYD